MLGYASRPLLALAALALATSALRAQDAASSGDGRPAVAVMHFNNGAIGKDHEELGPLRGGMMDAAKSGN